MTTEREIFYGVRLPNGDVYSVSESDARNGYLTAEEYAKIRAKALDGTVVFRVRWVTLTDWTPAP